MVGGKEINKDEVVQTLNGILELELAGVVRYMHYSFMIYGHNRIPVVSWMREQAQEGMTHAALAGEMITSLGGHPSLKIGSLLETEKHGVNQILQEALEHEKQGIALYYQLLEQVKDRNVRLEEYARAQVVEEEDHIAEIHKMMKAPMD
jgi:bacterioferritin